MPDAQERSVDDILEGLAEIVRGAAGSGSTPDAEGVSPTPRPGSNGNSGKPVTMQQQLGKEYSFQRLIPPLNASTRHTLDEVFLQIPEMLKTISARPFLQLQMDQSVAIAMLSQQASDERQSILPLLLAILRGGGFSGPLVERNIGLLTDTLAEDPEMSAVLEQMRGDIVGTVDERVAPVIFYLVMASGAGVAVGRALGDL